MMEATCMADLLIKDLRHDVTKPELGQASWAAHDARHDSTTIKMLQSRSFADDHHVCHRLRLLSRSSDPYTHYSLSATQITSQAVLTATVISQTCVLPFDSFAHDSMRARTKKCTTSTCPRLGANGPLLSSSSSSIISYRCCQICVVKFAVYGSVMCDKPSFHPASSSQRPIKHSLLSQSPTTTIFSHQ